MKERQFTNPDLFPLYSTTKTNPVFEMAALVLLCPECAKHVVAFIRQEKERHPNLASPVCIADPGNEVFEMRWGSRVVQVHANGKIVEGEEIHG